MYETSYSTNKALYTYKDGPGLDHKENSDKFQKLVQEQGIFSDCNTMKQEIFNKTEILKTNPKIFKSTVQR